LAQSDLQAKALQSGHPDAGGMYHATVRLSLEPDLPYLGLSGLWRFYENGIGSACWKVRYQILRTVTFDTYQMVNFPDSGSSTFDIRGAL
jgi:hypothetical protein